MRAVNESSVRSAVILFYFLVGALNHNLWLNIGPAAAEPAAPVPTSTVHFRPLWPSSVLFFLKKQHTLQLELGSTCAVHSNTSKVEQTASEYCPAFVWQDLAKLVRMNVGLIIFHIYS